jgi:hypothetical protein
MDPVGFKSLLINVIASTAKGSTANGSRSITPLLASACPAPR